MEKSVEKSKLRTRADGWNRIWNKEGSSRSVLVAGVPNFLFSLWAFIKTFLDALISFGTFSTSVCMVLIGICAYFQEYFPFSPYLDTFSWIPFLSVIIAVIVRAICILPVIYSVMSEIFPTEDMTSYRGGRRWVGMWENGDTVTGTSCLHAFISSSYLYLILIILSHPHNLISAS